MFNVVEGGRHGAGNLDFQEFLVIPSKVNSFDRAIQIGVEIYMSLKKTLTFKDAITSVGDEGGYAPNFYTNSDAFEVIEEAVNQTRYKLGNDVFFGLDVAANTLRTGSFYRIKDRSSEMNVDDMIDFYQELIDRFRIISIEDPIFEDDWDGWVKITGKLGQQLIIVGDDLLVTNQKLVQRAIKSKAVNAMIAKLNQAGTVTETLDVIKLAKSANWQIVVSHRAGETDDDFIADLAVAVGADYAKFGAPSRGERVAKYNRLWEIFLVHSKNEH
jgi:enolase